MKRQSEKERLAAEQLGAIQQCATLTEYRKNGRT